MARTASVHPDSIDPSTIDLPTAFGERLQTVFGFETRPETYGDWAQRIVATFETERNEPLTTSDLCDVEDSPHSATVGGETTHYMCAQDPLVVGLLADEPVTVESTPPNGDEPVRFEFGPDGITVEPEGALFSFGVANDAERPEELTPQALYGLVCPYGHAFPDAESYRGWARGVEAVTDVLSVPASVAVMGELIDVAGVEEVA